MNLRYTFGVYKKLFNGEGTDTQLRPLHKSIDIKFRASPQGVLHPNDADCSPVPLERPVQIRLFRQPYRV